MFFVTGATGLLGNNIVRTLIDQGQRVRVLSRRKDDASLEGLDIEIVEGDLSAPDLLARCIDGCSNVIHGAALIHIGWQRVEESRSVNVLGTENIIRACRESRAKLCYVSTVDTLPAARSPEEPISESTTDGVPKVDSAYVVSKREAEQSVEKAIENGEIEGCIVHPGFMLGPYDWKPSSGRMFREVTSAPILAAPPGGGSVCDVRDVAAATIVAAEKFTNAEHFILGGYNISYRQLWAQMLKAAGKRERRILRLRQRVQYGGRIIDAVNRLLSLKERDVNGATIAMGCLKHYYDSSLAKKVLGYNNRPLDETLTDAWQWLKEL